MPADAERANDTGDGAPPELISISNVIIDDIVLWDGSSHMGVLGGSGVHAVAGMRVWHSGVIGLAAYVGSDLPAATEADLDELRLESEGIVPYEGVNTPRAWQIFERDGRRSEIFRTSMEEFFSLSGELDRVPEAWWQAAGTHLNVGAHMEDILPALRRLKANGSERFVMMEPTLSSRRDPATSWRPALELADCVFVNRLEAQELTGEPVPALMADAIQKWGPAHVVIGMAAEGALVSEWGGSKWRIKAYPVQAEDETGGGNSLSGGLLAGAAGGLPLIQAAQQGVVSASFAVSRIGPIAKPETLRSEAQIRLQWVRDNTERLA